MFETTVSVVGYVITEPRVRQTAGGERVASFRVVSTARRFDRENQRWVDGDRFFATVQCWRNLAEAVERDVRKRTGVVVSGRLRTREYETGGEWRTAVEIEATAVGIDLVRQLRDGSTGAVPGAESDAIPPQRSGECSVRAEPSSEHARVPGG